MKHLVMIIALSLLSACASTASFLQAMSEARFNAARAYQPATYQTYQAPTTQQCSSYVAGNQINTTCY